jgi:hypothetical protein
MVYVNQNRRTLHRRRRINTTSTIACIVATEVLPTFSFKMDMIRRFFELLKWCGAEARTLALEASPLRKLPPELILHIASYLPPESAASLALSCHALHSCLGLQCLQPLKKAECSVLNGFLRLLDRDLPGHLLCPHCNKFHSMSSAEAHLPSRRTSLTSKPSLACWKADSGTDVKMATHFEFSSTIFRMAMKAHRQGHDTANLINLLSYGTMNFVRSGFIEQCSATVRIQDGSLLVREQRVFMIPSSQKLPLPWHGGIDICPHIQFATMLGLYKYGIQIPHSDAIEGYENRQGIIYCEHCYTEFRVDFKGYGRAGNAMFVTRWMDIGEGRDPSDFKWRSRLWYHTGTMRRKATFRRGSICAAFEQKADSEFKFDSLLTAQNVKDLRTKSPWPWPENVELSCDRVRRYFVVRHGTFVPF